MSRILSGKFHIKKRPLPQWLTLYLFFMSFLVVSLQSFLGLPAEIKYTLDVAWVLIIALLFLRKKVVLYKKLIPFLILIGVFIAYTALVYILRFQSPFYYLWGFRNNFRFYFAFIAFCMLFVEDDVELCLKFVDVLFWINAVVTLFQFFVLGYRQDYLGGIFGVERGCNGYSIIFFTIVISKSILKFMSREEHVLICIAKCSVALLISAMAELKFFFLLFMLIFLLSTILTSFSWRKFFLVFVCALLISFTGSLLTELFGESSNISLDRIIELIFTDTYSTAEDLSRYTAIPTLSSSVMTDTSQRLLGLGLGNCDTSSFEICNTPFFNIYSHLHYNWFLSAFLFLETGYIGLLIYLMFFVMCFVCAFNLRKREGINVLYCQMAIILSLICILITFYNSALRMETGYMAYFVLALPLISSKPELQYKRRLNIHK